MSRALRRCGLPAQQLKALQAARLHTAADVLLLSELELMRAVDCSCDEVAALLVHLSSFVVPKGRTALELLQTRSGSDGGAFLPLQQPLLDGALGGGLPRGLLTELVGPSGVGKTQFCLTAAAALCASSTGASVLYIDAENKFDATRLLEIAVTAFPQQFCLPEGWCAADAIAALAEEDGGEVGKSDEDAAARACCQALRSLLARVTVHSADSAAEVMDILQRAEEEIISCDVRLLVLDSIAAPLRREYGGSASLRARMKQLAGQSALLKQLGETFQLAVLVTNQVTTSFLSSSALSTAAGGGGETLLPALGTSWSHFVNLRLVLQDSTPPLRSLSVAKSPITPAMRLLYEVTPAGVAVVQDSPLERLAGGDSGVTTHRGLLSSTGTVAPALRLAAWDLAEHSDPSAPLRRRQTTSESSREAVSSAAAAAAAAAAAVEFAEDLQ